MTHPAESDGINEMVEGAHRAVSTGVLRWIEMLGWRGRDHAYDRAAAANRDVDQALAERDLAEGHRALGDALVERETQGRRGGVAAARGDGDGWRSPLLDPADHGRTPTRGGDEQSPATVDADGRQPATVGADGVEPVDFLLRAELHAQTQAALDGRDFYDGTDIDDALAGWAASRAAEAGHLSPDSPHWQRWAVFEADDHQLRAAERHAAAVAAAGPGRIAAAYRKLQLRVAEAARTDDVWRATADQRAAAETVRLQTTVAASGGAHARHSEPAVFTGDPETDQALLLHDLTFAARLTSPTNAGRRHSPRPATRGRTPTRTRQRGLTR